MNTTDNIVSERHFRRLLQDFVKSAGVEAHVSVRPGGDALLARIECKNLQDAELVERAVLQRRGEFGERGADTSVIVQFPGVTVSLPLPVVKPEANAARGEAFLSKTFPTKPEPFAW
jgi:hypothetical protein